jgi:hypothetical protein
MEGRKWKFSSNFGRISDLVVLVWLFVTWDIYCICNEQNKTISEVWDGTQLKLTFTRNFSDDMMLIRHELCQISSDEDYVIAELNSTGVYDLQSLYAINFSGVSQIYIPAICQLKILPSAHIFIWLMSHNRLLTTYILAKREYINDESCHFCSEHEIVTHLFFECAIAKLSVV